MVTLKKIAELANVSIGTVDRVIHNRGEVSEATDKNIRSIMKALDYKPNVFARHLVLSKSFQFGVIMPKLTLDSGYWKRSAIGINRAHRELNGQKIKIKYFYFNKYSDSSFEKVTQRVMDNPLDGFLIAPGTTPAFHHFVNKVPGIPFVIFGSTVPHISCVSCIGQDAYQSGMMAGKLMHLSVREPGSLIIIRINPVDNHIEERRHGFLDYFQSDKEFIITTYDVKGNGKPEHFKKMFNKIIEENKNIRGIFVTNVLAHMIADQLKESALRKKIHLIGYDLVDENVAYLKDGTIDFLISQRPEIQGYRGVYSLYRHIVLKEPVKEKIMMQLEIVTKENIDYYQLYGTEF
jgi:LacI family transcriptional regulator